LSTKPSRTKQWIASHVDRIVLVGAVLFAALLRAWDLDLMSIWQDEGLSLYRAGLDLGNILRGFIPLGDLVTRDVHPPLYFLLLAAWSQLVTSDLWPSSQVWLARWLSLLASLPAVPLTWALARRLLDRRTGLVAALLAAASPLYLWYAQEIRSYSLVVTLGLLAVYLLARALDDDGSARNRLLLLLGCAGASAMLVWTHYLGFLLVAFEVLVVVLHAVRARDRRAMAPLAVLAVGILAALPLLPLALHRLGIGAERHQHFVPLAVILADVVRGFGLGRTFYLDPASTAGRVGAVAALAFAALLLTGLWHAWRARRPSALFLAGYLLAPVLGLYAITLLKPVYLGSYHLIAASPAFYILVAAGVSAIATRSRSAGILAGAVAIAPMVIASANYYVEPRFHKDDLRALARYVDQRAVPGDVLAVSDPVLDHSFTHLLRRLPVQPEPRPQASGLPDPRSPHQRLSPLLEGRRLWFMAPGDPDREWLDANAVLVDAEAFRGSGMPVYVRAYEADTDPETLDPLSDSALEQANLGGLRLIAWRAGQQPLEAGHAARVYLAWRPEGAVPDYKVALRLLDTSGRDWAEGDHEPFHGELPTSDWPVGETTVEPHDLLVSPAAPPGTYQLGVTVYDPSSGAVYPPDGPLELGEVDLSRPQAPIDPHMVEVGDRVWAEGGGIAVFGISASKARVNAGEHLPVEIWLQVTEAEPAARSVRLELIDARGRVLSADEEQIPLGDAATPGDLRRLSFGVPMPPQGGTYGLRLRVLDDGGGTLWLRRGLVPSRGVWLRPVLVAAPERTTTVPEMDNRLDVAVGEDIELLGFDGGIEDLLPGESVTVTLYWKATGQVTTSYHVTLQVVPTAGLQSSDPAGPPVAQSDGVPAGNRPTDGWVGGEVIADARTLTVPEDASPGAYMVIAALYDPQAPDAPRPLVEQDHQQRDFVLLGRLVIATPSANRVRSP